MVKPKVFSQNTEFFHNMRMKIEKTNYGHVLRSFRQLVEGKRGRKVVGSGDFIEKGKFVDFYTVLIM